jgi:uncharacterized membrane protein YdjX (TVP38/TMEM64 family)
MALIAVSLISRRHLSADRLLAIVHDLGILAPLGFIPFSAFLLAIFMPPILLLLVGWLAFGIVLGASCSVVGMTAGSCLAFVAGRYLIGEVSITLSAGRVGRTLEKVSEVIKLHGFLTVVGLKFLFAGHPAVDYGVSRTEITLRDHFYGTFIGLIPRAFALSYLFEIVLRPALVAVEGLATGASMEILLYERLLGKPLIEHAFIWLITLTGIRVCGVALLGLLIKRCHGASIARS